MWREIIFLIGGIAHIFWMWMLILSDHAFLPVQQLTHFYISQINGELDFDHAVLKMSGFQQEKGQ